MEMNLRREQQIYVIMIIYETFNGDLDKYMTGDCKFCEKIESYIFNVFSVSNFESEFYKVSFMPKLT